MSPLRALRRPVPARRRPAAPSPPSAPRIRLVHVTTVPETLGFLRGQAAALAAEGIEAAAVSAPGPELEAFGRREGVAVHGIPMARAITPWADLKSLVAMVRLFRRLKPDLVHAHTPKGGLLGMLAARIAGVPARLYTMHGLPLETARGLKRVLVRTCERVSCALARRVHAVSPSLRRRALREGLVRPEKIRVLGPGTVDGVDAGRRFCPGPDAEAERQAVLRDLRIPPEARVLGFVGRVVRDKGVVELESAWSALREEFPDLHLLLVGPQERQDPVPEEVLARLRHDRRVRMPGPLASTRGAYAAMDVVALPSRREGFPQVPLEAAAMAKPAVVTDATGCVDAVVDGRTGRRVPVGDAPALVEALRGYLRDPELRARHGRAARERVLRDFRPEDVRARHVREYLELAGRRPRAPRRRPGRRPLDLLLKRLIDAAGAALGLAVFAPVMAVVALLVKVTMGGPVLFRQPRPGLRGRPFELVKFRTMRAGDAPDDQRLTAVGRFLRSTSLDELPQLWNVLKGDMSLVGPRPLMMQYLPRYTPEQARRHEAAPGITGAAQVKGRNSLTWEERFALDVWYVDHGSLLEDLRILRRTLARVVSRKGVDAPGGGIMPEFMGTPNGDNGTLGPGSVCGSDPGRRRPSGRGSAVGAGRKEG